jgi:hypothetical protein
LPEFIFSSKVRYIRIPTALIPSAGFPLTLVIPAFLVPPLGLVGTTFVVMIAAVVVVVMVMGIVLGALMLMLTPAVVFVGMLTVVTTKPTAAAMTTATAGMSTATAATMTSAPATPMTVGMNRRGVEAHNRQEDHSYHQRNRQ